MSMISGQEIRSKRKSLGLSANDLALKINVKLDNLYKWEKGAKPQDPEDYLKLMNWYNGKLESVPHETKPHTTSVQTIPDTC